MKKLLILLGALALTLSCEKDELYEETISAPSEEVSSPTSLTGLVNYNEKLKIVTVNVASASTTELRSIRRQIRRAAPNANIICLQEVKHERAVLEVFKSGRDHRDEGDMDSFPYYAQARNSTTARFPEKNLGIMVLSKFPIVKQFKPTIQTDPSVHKWTRSGLYTRIKVNYNTSIDLFTFHNTMNKHRNHSEWERRGMRKFREWVDRVLGKPLTSDVPRVFLAGDFNLGKESCYPLLGHPNVLEYAASENNKKGEIDQIVNTKTYPRLRSQGLVRTYGNSDHDGVWATYDLTTNRARALRDVVRVYEHSGARGRMAAFEVGDYYYLPEQHWIRTYRHQHWWNDRISSIRVGGYLRGYLYDGAHYRGRRWLFTGGHRNDISGSNDKISSMRVRRR
ncbi:hypothetical protein FGM00_11175 [Aggregatimonas sangjinii]|uniref:Endonuclease/exonuclease/phosphatase domain-containing protein n=1 Tax=Aggregatimonas sangjinii TaxID=2583587 RepID=A0A5B7SUD4_9FLAO|nr:endonuclease/exonuclease/phosphatase family protein [Aggregatimonas sangjinii]QCX00638.1 hypothetical protein FGM00_11175 [Aggregatimonas sangjinii]